MSSWIILAVIVILVAVMCWPEPKGAWEEHGDGYLYTYRCTSSGFALGEVFPERSGWTARVHGVGSSKFSTIEAAMRHVETEAKP